MGSSQDRGRANRGPLDAPRRCTGCSTVLAADNTADMCGRCHRDQRDQLRTPPVLRDDFWKTDEFRAAFESHHMGKVFRAYRHHPRHLKQYGKALNQELLGRWLGIPQGKISKLENDKPEQNIEILCEYAEKLKIPRNLLWFAFPGDNLWKMPQTGSAQQSESNSVADYGIQEVDRLAAEILGSSTANEAIEQLTYATTSLAESHTQAPARHVLDQVLRLHKQAQSLLGRKPRLSQTRDLFRVESDLLAHACLLLDDLKQNMIAQKYGTLALSFSKEAGTAQATARTALAKALRWDERLIESADMAKAGYECSPATPVRIQLASQEANAAALMGNIARAKEALGRAEVAAATVTADSGISAWSFPVGRQAIFALSVALQSKDPDAALRAVSKADESWQSGAPLVQANWAQIRVGAGVAYLLKGSLDAAIGEVQPVLDLPSELRISTVTAYMDKLDSQLRNPLYKGSNDVDELRQAIQDFNSAAPFRDPPIEG